MASETEVLNAVAATLAENSVTSLADDAKVAQKARQRWSLDLDAALRAHPWNFATRILPAPQLSGAPLSGYAYAYQRSVDPWDLRVLKVSDQVKGDRWRVIGREIHTDLEAPLTYEAVVRITDTTKWDAMFASYFADLVASNIAFAMTGLRTISERIMAQADHARRAAWSVDGQEDNREDDLIDRSGSILAGYGSPSSGDRYYGEW